MPSWWDQLGPPSFFLQGKGAQLLGDRASHEEGMSWDTYNESQSGAAGSREELESGSQRESGCEAGGGGAASPEVSQKLLQSRTSSLHIAAVTLIVCNMCIPFGCQEDSAEWIWAH